MNWHLADVFYRFYVGPKNKNRLSFFSYYHIGKKSESLSVNYCQSCALCRQNCSTTPSFIHVGELHRPGLLGFINCSSHMVNCLFLWRVDGFFSELSVSISPFNCSSSLLSCHSPMRWKFSEKMRVLCTEHSCYQKPGHTGRGAGHWILVWNAKITKVENIWFSFWRLPVLTKRSQCSAVFNLTWL